MELATRYMNQMGILTVFIIMDCSAQVLKANYVQVLQCKIHFHLNTGLCCQYTSAYLPAWAGV